MQISAEEGYRLWAPTYDSAPNPLLALEERLLRGLLQGTEAGRVVDIGCGTARWARYFRSQGAAAFAIDLSPEMLEMAGRYPELSQRLMLGDASNLPLRDQSMDLLVCSFALGHMSNLAQVFAEWSRIAHTGATLAISDLHPDALTAGWTGTFRVDDTVYSIVNYRHSLEMVRATAESAGFLLVSQTQAHLSARERAVLERGGKGDKLEALRRTPALWIGVWEKP